MRLVAEYGPAEAARIQRSLADELEALWTAQGRAADLRHWCVENGHHIAADDSGYELTAAVILDRRPAARPAGSTLRNSQLLPVGGRVAVLARYCGKSILCSLLDVAS